MSNLWNPGKDTRAALNAGNRKIKLFELKQWNYLKKINCPFCDKPVYFRKDTQRYLTLRGSDHSCTGVRKDRTEIVFEESNQTLT